MLHGAAQSLFIALVLGGLSIASVAQVTASWTNVAAINPAQWRGWSAMTWDSSQNRIVLWGGLGGSYLNDIQAFDPVTRFWTEVRPNQPCFGNTSLLVPNGSDENVVVYDPINNLLWISNGGSGYRCGTPQAIGRTAGAGTTSTTVVGPTLTGATVDYNKDWMVRVSGPSVAVTGYDPTTKTRTLVSPLALAQGEAYDLYGDFGRGANRLTENGGRTTSAAG